MIRVLRTGVKHTPASSKWRLCALYPKYRPFIVNFSTSKAAFNESAESEDDGPPVSFKFIEQSSGEVIEVTSARGKKMVDVALDNDVDIEAACGGELACSTCHVVLDKKLYDILPGKLEEEDDMLDLAMGLTTTSRLSCQLLICDDMEGAEIVIPEED